jgi:replicative DNA helicase
MNAPLPMSCASIESEQHLLGGLLIDNGAFDRIVGAVSEADLFREDHRRIFRCIARLLEAGKPADFLTVSESLETSGELAAAGGMAYLADLVQATASAANIRRYAEIIRERAVMRRLLTAGDEIAALATAAGMTLAEKTDRAQALVMAAGGETSGEELVSMDDLTRRLTLDLQERADRDGKPTGLATRFKDLDQITGGFQRSDLIVVAARPGMGKTAFALNVAEEVCIAAVPALFVTLEMPAEQLGHRLIADIGRVQMSKIRKGQLTCHEWQEVSGSLDCIRKLPMRISDAYAPTVMQVRAMARKARRELGGLGLVVVDYLQLMSGSGDSRAEQIASITRGLKALAKELGCVVIALSQLNRQLEQRPNKRPVMSDLRESGAIEQDADLILFVYRDEIYNPNSPEAGTAELIIGKHRNGPLGTVRLAYLGENVRFENLAKGWRPSAPEKYSGYDDGFES